MAGAKCMAVLATHGGGAHLSTSVDARQRPGSLLASACPPRLCCSDAIAAGERWTVYHLGPRGSVKTFCEHEWMHENVRDIEARVYRGARVPGPRGVARALAGYGRRVRCGGPCLRASLECS